MHAKSLAGVKAIVFDIDGTLYNQRQLRRLMLMRLLRAHALRPFDGWQTAKILGAYRRAQEHLRLDDAATDIAAAQIALASQNTGVSTADVVECVNRWMEAEPLPLLGRCLQPGLIEFLNQCRRRGLRLGTLSDYPSTAKLRAMGLDGLFELALSAQASDVNALKPNPRGLLLAIQRLEATPSETLYVGDRVDVDVPTAKAAGASCAILGSSTKTDALDESCYVFATFAELHTLLWGPFEGLHKP